MVGKSNKQVRTSERHRKPVARIGGRIVRALLALGFSATALLLGFGAAGSIAAPSTGSGGPTTAYQCTGSPITLFTNWNGGAVASGGTAPTFDTGGQPYCLVSISTYHWNGGDGATPGTISLASETSTLGPWTATGSPGSPTETYPEGVPNANWTVAFGSASQPIVINGDYVCEDSDPATWSQNATSGGQGFCKVVVQNAVPVTTSTTTTTTTSTTPVNPPPVEPPVAPPAGNLPQLNAPPITPCDCAKLDVHVIGEYHAGYTRNPQKTIETVRVMWRLDCTGSILKFATCNGTLHVTKPAGSTVLGIDSVADVPVRNPNTGKVHLVEVRKPQTDPVTCSGRCGPTPSVHTGTLEIRFLLNESATDLVANGLQFDITTNCKLGGKQVHKLDLEFHPSGNLDRRLSILT